VSNTKFREAPFSDATSSVRECCAGPRRHRRFTLASTHRSPCLNAASNSLRVGARQSAEKTREPQIEYYIRHYSNSNATCLCNSCDILSQSDVKINKEREREKLFAKYITKQCIRASFVKNPLVCFLCCPRNSQNLSQFYHPKGVKTCFFIVSGVARAWYQAVALRGSRRARQNGVVVGGCQQLSANSRRCHRSTIQRTAMALCKRLFTAHELT